MKIKLKLSKHSERAKEKYIIPFIYSLVWMGVFFSLYYYFKYDAINLSIVCALASLAALMLPLVRKLFRSHVITANYIVTVLFLTLTFLVMHTGGMKASAVWWLGTVPILASFLLNAPLAVLWYIFVIIDFVVIYYLQKHNSLPVNILEGAPLERLMLTSLFFCTSLITALCTLADSLREKTSREKEELQKKSYQLSQLASLGKLSAGVAHEINNPLAVIRGSRLKITRMIQSEQAVDKKMLEHYMEMIDRNIERISQITSAMRSISSNEHGKQQVEAIHLQDLLNSLVDVFQIKLKAENIKLQLYFCDEPVFFEGVSSEIFQAFFNMMENAVDELKQIEGERRIEISLEKNEDHVNVYFRDNGRGVQESMNEKIYEPFFTTKGIGEGKGLGLTYAYNVFTNNGGRLELESESKMTSFKVNLPIRVAEEVIH